MTARFDRKLYETGIAMSEEERQNEAEKQLRKLGVTVGLLSLIHIWTL